mgnify:CR=1 FL=1
MGGSRLVRWGLVIVGLGSSVLALWLFLAPFRIQVFEGRVFEVGEIADPSQLRPDLAANCSAPFRQVFSSPLESPGIQFVSVTDLQPICLNVARNRTLASVGFAVAALLALVLATRTARPTPRSPSDG